MLRLKTNNFIEKLVLLLEFGLLKIYKINTLPDKPRVLDGGANNGFFSYYIKKYFPNAKITAVEPHPLTIKNLKHNLDIAGIEDIEIIEKAISTDEEVYISTEANSIANRVNSIVDEKHTVKVDTISLKNLIKEDAYDLVKLDIEISEYPVLLDAVEHLDKVENYVVELHRPLKYKNEIDEIEKNFAQIGLKIEYSFYGINLPKSLIYVLPSCLIHATKS